MGAAGRSIRVTAIFHFSQMIIILLSLRLKDILRQHRQASAHTSARIYNSANTSSSVKQSNNLSMRRRVSVGSSFLTHSSSLMLMIRASDQSFARYDMIPGIMYACYLIVPPKSSGHRLHHSADIIIFFNFERSIPVAWACVCVTHNTTNSILLFPLPQINEVTYSRTLI